MNSKIPKRFNSLSMPHTFDLFATKVFVLRNKDFIEDNKSLVKSIKKHRIENKKSVRKSNYGGFHSDLDIGSLNGFKKIKLKLIDSYASIISINYRHECILNKDNYKDIKKSFESMWFIINSKNNSNSIHMHPRAWLACSYYIKLPEKNNIIMFHDPIQARKQDADYIKHNVPIMVEEGDVVFFPGWFEHSVPENTSDEDRIVISCNFRKPNFIGKIKEK